MKIYAASTKFNWDDYIGKDLWIEVQDFGNGYHYIHPLRWADDTYGICCNSVSSYLIDLLDPECLWDEFPRYPAEPIDLNKILLGEEVYEIANLNVVMPLNVLTTTDVREYLEICLDRLRSGDFIGEE